MEEREAIVRSIPLQTTENDQFLIEMGWYSDRDAELYPMSSIASVKSSRFFPGGVSLQTSSRVSFLLCTKWCLT